MIIKERPKEFMVSRGKQYLRFAAKMEEDPERWRWTFSPWEAKKFKTKQDAKKYSVKCSGEVTWFDSITGEKGNA